MITSIHLENFRIFSKLDIDCNHKLVIFSGKNAVGKTSILEAIYLIATSKSHRTNDISSIIKNDSNQAIIEIKENKRFKIILDKENKYLFINKVQISKVSEFIGNLEVVLFSPSQLSLINGSPSERRKFLDLELSILNKEYLKVSSRHKKILSERNDLLKNNDIDEILLNIYTEDLISQIKIIYKYRIDFINNINEILTNICKDINIENIRINYIPSYSIDNISNNFSQKKKQDILLKSTSIGTHRDDFQILINDKSAKEYASEGQKRTICITIMLALKEYIKIITGNEPVLLLDDVFMALDKDRIEGLISYVKNSKQCFITTTSILEIPDEILKEALVIRISN